MFTSFLIGPCLYFSKSMIHPLFSPVFIGPTPEPDVLHQKGLQIRIPHINYVQGMSSYHLLYWSAPVCIHSCVWAVVCAHLFRMVWTRSQLWNQWSNLKTDCRFRFPIENHTWSSRKCSHDMRSCHIATDQSVTGLSLTVSWSRAYLSIKVPLILLRF